MPLRRVAPLAALVVSLVSLSLSPSTSSAAAPRAEAPSARALELQRSARRALLEASAEGRQRAIQLLEQAIALEPDNPTHWHLLGEVYASARYGTKSRACFARALSMAPHDADGWFLSGMAWRREWRRLPDSTALDRAIAAFDTCTRLDPERGEAWLYLSGLLYEEGDLDRALAAAETAGERGAHPECNQLARAYLTFRIGDIAGAESLFERALPRLDPSVRRWFEEPWIVLDGTADLRASRSAAPDSNRTPFWESRDPDPTTPENEFRLEYWARVAHAFLLFDDPLEPRFDARAITYVRYGPPAAVTVVNGTTESMMMMPVDDHLRSLAEYPFISQVWDYPQYGMRIRLDDRTLVGHYARTKSRADDPASSPAGAMLNAQPDVVSIDGGDALFTARPPKRQRLELLTLHTRFEGDPTRLSSQVRVRAAAEDSVVARWLVYDAAGHEVAREARALGLSACAPESLEVARFSVALPGGEYRVFVSASDRRHRRSLREAQVIVSPPGRGVGISDIVGVCSEPATQVDGGTVLLEAAEEPRVQGEQALGCYFEIARLSRSAEGRYRFQYRYRVQRLDDRSAADGTPTEGPVLSDYASEDIEVGGPLRRQFVSIPTRTLAPARYRLTVRVRDLASGSEAERLLDFAKE